MTEDRPISTLELGGHAIPTFSVLSAGSTHIDYGAISVMASRDSIDPKQKSVSIFAGDTWTTTSPEKS